MKKIYVLFALLVVGILAVVWLTQKPKSKSNTDNAGAGSQQADAETGQDASFAGAGGDYDSLDTAIVVGRSLNAKTITLRNLETGRQYTLNYSGTSVLCDANARPLSMEQIYPGLIVDVAFMMESKHLTSLRESTSAFVFRDYSSYEISDNGASIEIEGSKYKISDIVVVGNGLDVVSVLDIHDSDVLTIRGFDREVYSLVIDKGHGYLTLENDEAFIGGWIEVGSTLIRPITEDMILTVPEGTYEVSVSNKGSSGIKTVVIERDQEAVMDVGDLVSEVKTGKVLFAITPSNASVYVDGDKVDAKDALTLTYGIHQVIFKADGYETLAKYVKVGQDKATLEIIMKSEAEPDDTATPSPGAENVSPSPSAEASATPQDGLQVTLIPTPNLLVTMSPYATPTPQTIPLPTGSATLGDVSITSLPSVTPTQGANPSGDKYYVHIDSPEGAEVYVDGNYVGIAPLKFEKSVGTHEVILRKEGYQTRSYTIEVNDQPSDISYSFSELRELSNG